MASQHQHHIHLKTKPPTSSIPSYLLKLLVLQSLLNALGHSQLPNVLLAGATECTLDADCSGREKICHENKCICPKDRPIEDQDRCLSTALISEPCTLNEQCLGNSYCGDGVCTCGIHSVSLFNPSAKLNYCHPKRQLKESCVHDQQCPQNAYCSSEKMGCLCENGFGANIVNNGAFEREECLPVSCSDTSPCFEDSDFHFCKDNKCFCLATHFDPTTSKCYKFGSTGGKPVDDLNLFKNTTDFIESKHSNDSYSILKDLTHNGDKLWLILLLLISVALVALLILSLIRKYCLVNCWTARKQEYEPNNKSLPRSNLLNKNSINNKSFRKKSAESDDVDTSGLTADLSNLVAGGDKTGKRQPARLTTALVATSNTNNGNDHVKVNMNGAQSDTFGTPDGDTYHLVEPLKTSTSTPV